MAKSLDPRRLPPVHAVLAHLEERGSPSDSVGRAVRLSLEEARRAILVGESTPIDVESLANRALAIVRDSGRPHLRPVLNATGILLHTGLGRAPLAAEAVEAISRVVRGYCNLEIDLESGERGHRGDGVAELLRRLTGAEAAAVVNNNAAATVLALRALAHGRDVVVSRGQLVEIGGSFRLPEIFEASGARLREVGTTNKTRLTDYEAALGPETAALLRVHASNYRIVGFTADVPIGELARLARSRGIWAIDDIGSGALSSDRPPNLRGEPSVSKSLKAGAHLVLCSGDKLLGGPQCGLLIGSREAVARCSSDPLMRAFRVDKLTLAAMEATLRLALDAPNRIPLWSFLATPVEELRRRAEVLAESVRDRFSLNASAVASVAHVGGGSVPVDPIPSAALRIDPPFPAPLASEEAFATALRLGNPAVLTRLHAGGLLLDLRALSLEDETSLVSAFASLVSGGPGRGLAPGINLEIGPSHGRPDSRTPTTPRS